MADFNYSEANIPTNGIYTKIDYPIVSTQSGGKTTYIDHVQFGQADNFGYNHNGSNPILPTAFNNWQGALEAIHAYLDNINKRLEALENGSGDEPVEPTYTVICNVSNGSKSPNSTQTIESGGSVSWTITPNSGYQMPTSVTGAAINGNRVTVSNVTSDRTINVNCAAIPVQTYTVTCNVYNGSKSPNNTQTIESGGSVSWTITPNSGYQMPTSVTGAAINGNRVTVNNVTSNRTISVTCVQSQPQTTNYWYIGTTKPTSLNDNGVTTVTEYDEEVLFTNPSATEKCYIHVLTNDDKTVDFYDPSDLSTPATKTEDLTSIPGCKITSITVRIAMGGTQVIKIS